MVDRGVRPVVEKNIPNYFLLCAVQPAKLAVNALLDVVEDGTVKIPVRS